MARHSRASKYRRTWPAEVEESRGGAGEEKRTCSLRTRPLERSRQQRCLEHARALNGLNSRNPSRLSRSKRSFSSNVVRLQGGTDKKTEKGLGFSSNVVKLQGGTDKKTEKGLVLQTEAAALALEEEDKTTGEDVQQWSGMAQEASSFCARGTRDNFFRSVPAQSFGGSCPYGVL
ncbi:hypothetical protein NDU88_007448 [Pleurodeles waltl]|uniref:Uncharacterized protein n=1 Tax=Pleurodeles waltl TaxID=8319 RepID=A0AAV7QLX5_PLEWA|nr:hypothetical protein NDU88_007448 [Pleurodeles waltl]